MNILPLSIRICLLTAVCAPLSAMAAGPVVPAGAQALAIEATAATGNTLWSARTGGYRPLSGYGLDADLADDSLGSTLVLQTNNRLSMFSSLFGTQAYERGSASVPWCAESSGLLRIGSLGQECLMQGMLQFELPGRVASAQAGVNFSGQNWDVTLSYGLSWLMDKLELPGGAQAHLRDAEFLANSSSLPTLLNQTDVQTQGLAVGAQWRLTQASALQLNAALNQLRVNNGYVLPGLNINEAQAGVGLVYGPFSGNVSGHMQRAHSPSLPGAALWGGLDLGVSWRTPWRGELTIGARNLVTKGEEPLLPDPQAANPDRTSTRTPYVRYKQDL
jgi:hypothetical protein